MEIPKNYSALEIQEIQLSVNQILLRLLAFAENGLLNQSWSPEDLEYKLFYAKMLISETEERNLSCKFLYFL